MRRLHLPFAEPAKGAGAEGTVIARTSPMGFEFALVSGGAQTIAGQAPADGSGLWLGLLVGAARVSRRATQTALSTMPC